MIGGIIKDYFKLNYDISQEQYYNQLLLETDQLIESHKRAEELEEILGDNVYLTCLLREHDAIKEDHKKQRRVILDLTRKIKSLGKEKQQLKKDAEFGQTCKRLIKYRDYLLIPFKAITGHFKKDGE